MADSFTPEKPSWNMAQIGSKNTGPELVVRKLVHSLGFRFRLHCKELPGTPDLVFPGKRKVILVHGCFWHGHNCNEGARRPKTNTDYWLNKIAKNQLRDAKTLQALLKDGWQVLTIWECQKCKTDLAEVVRKFLS
jgi:DNA mismatch endonuclease, patch repair protein